MDAKEFAPWRVDYWIGGAWCLLGIVGGWMLLASFGYWVSAVVACWPLLKGWGRIVSGLARKRGIEVERRAIGDWKVNCRQQTRRCVSDLRMMKFGFCVGNVDLLFEPSWSSASFCIEIKAYSGIVRRWFGLSRLGKYYRLWSPQQQVRGQCRFLGDRWHFPVLWLPESQLRNWFIHEGVLVVNGGVQQLVAGLQAFDNVIVKPVIVQFPWAPGDAITGVLKDRGYRYDGCRWHGHEINAYKVALENAWIGKGVKVWWPLRG